MDETTLARATEPFFSTKEAGKGTGLGLSIMQGVVTQSGGATRLRSQPGHGTQIEVWLPRAYTPPEASEIPEAQSEHRDSGAILVCDDNSAVLEFICDALKGKGYQVLPVTNGRKAISVLKANRSIRLLVVDFTMPEMNGAAVAREVRASRPQFPILLITGNADPESIQVDLPDVPMLRKPFDREQLTACVADLLEAEVV
jgi:CheY-like chemotaxis protein